MADTTVPTTTIPATAPRIPQAFPAFRFGGMGGIPGPPPYPNWGACCGIP
ncbi:hypothetical protein NCG97_22640 [Streptomyces lydicamycinicus]|nr:hypothetical protein [Streptomyces lydicamycinicus]USA05489.1 hypothetical protein NCG97_22640 [Streptomyces lydicamycinicus]